MSYVRQRTWIERGPRRGGIGIPRVRGLGDTPTNSWFQNWCASKASGNSLLMNALMLPATLMCPFSGNFAQGVVTNVTGSDVQGTGLSPAAPPPPIVTLTPTPTPGAVYAGTDESGNPVYAIPEAPQDYQNRVAGIDQANAALAAAPGGPAAPSDSTPWLAIGLSVAGLLLAANFMGGHK